MSRFLLLTVLLSAVLPSNYAEGLKLTYQNWIVTCTTTPVRERDCVLNLYEGNQYTVVAQNATGITVQYQYKTVMIAKFICGVKCGHGTQSYILDRVEITVNMALFIGILFVGASFPFLAIWCVEVWWKQRKRRRNARNIAPHPPPPVSSATSRDRARFHRNTPTVDSLRGPRDEMRTFQHTGPTSYRREELPRSPPTVPREEPSLAPVHAPPTASRRDLNSKHTPHIAPVEALPSYEQALEMISATDIPGSRC